LPDPSKAFTAHTTIQAVAIAIKIVLISRAPILKTAADCSTGGQNDGPQQTPGLVQIGLPCCN